MSNGLSDTLTTAAFRAAWQGIRFAPKAVAVPVFARIADRTYKKNGKGVQQLRSNLLQVRPDSSAIELEALVHAGMRSYLRYWLEVFRLPALSVEEVREVFIIDNVEIMDAHMAAGNGVIMVPGHLANWDLGGAWAADRYGGLASVAERLKPEAMYDLFLKYRQTLGMEVFPLGEPDVIRSLARVLKSGGMVALLGDRDIGGNGLSVEFLGAPATIPAGPALLSLMTGAAILPIGLWYDGEICRGHIYEPILGDPSQDRQLQMQTMTQKLADNLGDAIRRNPQDWHVLQQVWK
jgi:lauroyl/myristoyl acyltransferase